MADQDYQRKPTAILSADVAGYSLLMRDLSQRHIRVV